MKAKSIAFALCSLIALPFVAKANENCAPYDVVHKGLQGKYGESVQVQGLTDDGSAIFRVYANTETGSWSLVYISSTGMACLTGAGAGFTAPFAPPAPEGGES